MQAEQNTFQLKLRFTKWSRKSYAAFVTIGREVTIGVLAIQLCLRLSLKMPTHTLSRSLGLLFKEVEDKFSEDDLVLSDDVIVQAFLFGFLSQMSLELPSKHIRLCFTLSFLAFYFFFLFSKDILCFKYLKYCFRLFFNQTSESYE